MTHTICACAAYVKRKEGERKSVCAEKRNTNRAVNIAHTSHVHRLHASHICRKKKARDIEREWARRRMRERAHARDSVRASGKWKTHTGWRRLIGSPKLQIIFHKRATKYRSLLRKMTYKDKGSYESSPPCSR